MNLSDWPLISAISAAQQNPNATQDNANFFSALLFFPLVGDLFATCFLLAWPVISIMPKDMSETPQAIILGAIAFAGLGLYYWSHKSFTHIRLFRIVSSVATGAVWLGAMWYLLEELRPRDFGTVGIALTVFTGITALKYHKLKIFL